MKLGLCTQLVFQLFNIERGVGKKREFLIKFKAYKYLSAPIVLKSLKDTCSLIDSTVLRYCILKPPDDYA